MGDFNEQDLNERQVNSYLRNRVPKINEVICDLSFERGNVDDKLEELKAAINENSDSVSEKHKELLKKQAAAMEEYKRILGERIKDLIG